MTGPPSLPHETTSALPAERSGMELPWLDRVIGRQFPLSVIIAVLCLFFYLAGELVQIDAKFDIVRRNGCNASGHGLENTGELASPSTEEAVRGDALAARPRFRTCVFFF